MKKLLLLSVLISMACLSAEAKIYKLTSPDGKTTVKINVAQTITYSVIYNETEVLIPSAISMSLNGKTYGKDAQVKKALYSVVNKTVQSPLYKSASIKESYRQLDLAFKDGFGVIFRAYDNEGVAYRFYSTIFTGEEIVTAETAEFNFSKNYETYVAYSKGSKDNPYLNSFENWYTVTPLGDFQSDKIAFSPLLVSLDNGVKLAITESDLEDYPGMFLKKNDKKGMSLVGDFAKVPKQTETSSFRGELKVTEYTSNLAYITKKSSVKSPRKFPWRVLAIAENDAALPANNLVYLLGSPNRIGDISWIKPGKVAWDWWNDWNISGVDFKAGINTETYKYYIDFASKNGIEYVVLDEGWSEPLNIMNIVPDIDLQEIVDYGRSKNVDIVLWAVAYVLDKDLDKACEKYSKMGVKGFKIDFMNRDDQKVVNLLYKIAATCAKNHLIIDYHGMYKPAGMNRTFPNVINFEGIWGLEQMKWSPVDADMVTYDVTFPFIRQLAGPVDYTQGAMRNSAKGAYRPINSNPMSQGTRARQVAEYVVFDSPFVMLCDNPTAYMKEQETTDFITDIPTVWDETKVLQGEVGKYIVTARRKGNTWYIGGMTNWDARDITLDLNFIGGTKSATIFRDGINADRNGCDYKIEDVTVYDSTPMKVHLAPGGGFAMVIR